MTPGVWCRAAAPGVLPCTGRGGPHAGYGFRTSGTLNLRGRSSSSSFTAVPYMALQLTRWRVCLGVHGACVGLVLEQESGRSVTCSGHRAQLACSRHLLWFQTVFLKAPDALPGLQIRIYKSLEADLLGGPVVLGDTAFGDI